MMKQLVCVVLGVVFLQGTAFASVSGGFDIDAQMDALGKEELLEEIPESARELLDETGLSDVTVDSLLELTPGEFVKAVWGIFTDQLKQPLRVFATVVGIIILCALLGGMKTVAWKETLSGVFDTVSVLCILMAVGVPIINCIRETSRVIEDASVFMLSFIPMFAAALTAAGQPATGATYNMLLFSSCQVVAQVVSQVLVPMMSIYLAFCIVGTLVPDMNISSATKSIQSIVSWSLGFLVTAFVGLLSVQTMVGQSADTVTTKTAKFLIGSFVPVVGSALSDAYLAAQGCLRLLKTTLGAYGVVVAVCTFLPVLLQTVIWYLVCSLSAIVADLVGVPKVSAVLRSCNSVLAILLAVILCYGLLIVVSTTVVMVTGMGTG